MTDLSASGLKNENLRVLYRRVVSNDPRFVVPSYIRELIGSGGKVVTNQFVEMGLDGLLAEGLVKRGDPEIPSQRNRVGITDRGFDFVQSGGAFSEADQSIVDSWKEPDRGQALNVKTLDEVRSHLTHCIVLINESKFTQEEKAQIVGLLKICQDIIDLPTPKLGLLRKLLSWLKEIKELAPLVEFILKLMGKM